MKKRQGETDRVKRGTIGNTNDFQKRGIKAGKKWGTSAPRLKQEKTGSRNRPTRANRAREINPLTAQRKKKESIRAPLRRGEDCCEGEERKWVSAGQNYTA